MSLRNAFLGVVCAGCLFCPTWAPAQEQVGPEEMSQLIQAVRQLPQLAQDIRKMQQDIAELRASLDGQGGTASQPPMVPVQSGEAASADEEPQPSGPVAREEFERLKADVRANTDLIASRAGDMEALVQRQNNAIAVLEETNVAQEEMLAAISTHTGSGQAVPDVLGAMQDGATATAVSDAVRRAMPRQGRLLVTNRMGQAYTLLVNGRDRWRIPPTAEDNPAVIPVPVGTVSTELEGYEEPRHWSVSAPDFEQRIDIGPSRRTVAITPPVYYYDAYSGWWW
jgi:hypothetical protein